MSRFSQGFIGGKSISGTPFALSGTFAEGFDIWQTPFGGANWYPDSGISNSPCILTAQNEYIYYDIPNPGGLIITLSIFQKYNAGAGSFTRSIQYNIDGGAFTTLASVTDASSTFAQLTGSFTSVDGLPCQLRCVCGSGFGAQALWDSWSISGA